MEASYGAWPRPAGHRAFRLALAALVAAAAGLATAGTALGHEVRQVGDFEFVVGFMDEPVFVGQKSGLELQVTRGDEPVEGLEETLQAEVALGDQRRDLPLSPRFGEPGWYQSFFFPTAPGAYTFHISGTIDGTDVDESFTAGPDTFGEVEAATSGQFPVQFPATADLVADAERGADAAALLPVALALGGAGLLAGLVAIGLVLGMRRRAT
jgi:hypothetical protein